MLSLKVTPGTKCEGLDERSGRKEGWNILYVTYAYLLTLFCMCKKKSTCEEKMTVPSGSAGIVSTPQFFIDYLREKVVTHASAGIDGWRSAGWECWDWCECLFELLGVFTSWLLLYQGLIPQAPALQPSIFSDHTSSRILPEEAPLSSFPVLIPFHSSVAWL